MITIDELIDELIDQLTTIRNEHGNLPILTQVHGFGGHAVHLMSKVAFNTEFIGNEEDIEMLEDEGCNLSTTEVEQLITSPKDNNGNNKVVVIDSGSMLYST